jgi:hypothetical protein
MIFDVNRMLGLSIISMFSVVYYKYKWTKIISTYKIQWWIKIIATNKIGDEACDK